MGRMDGKVAFITGVANGQGRAHAVRLASEGCAIIGIDALVQYPAEIVHYPMGTEEDLQATVQAVEASGGKIIASKADVRDRASLQSALEVGLDTFGHLDVVVANAGVCSWGPPSWESPSEQWELMLDVNLTGVWNSVSVAVPRLLEAGPGGSIVITSSMNGLKGGFGIAAYAAAKHGVIGYMRSLALELGSAGIRANCVCPTSTDTNMINNPSLIQRFRPDLDAPTRQDAVGGFEGLTVLPVPWVEPVDVSNAVLWLASDESRYVTGLNLTVDAGQNIK